MPQTVRAFVSAIRSKHPEYADLGDIDLASGVLAKFPEYHDLLSPEAAQFLTGQAGIRQQQAADNPDQLKPVAPQGALAKADEALGGTTAGQFAKITETQIHDPALYKALPGAVLTGMKDAVVGTGKMIGNMITDPGGLGLNDALKPPDAPQLGPALGTVDSVVQGTNAVAQAQEGGGTGGREAGQVIGQLEGNALGGAALAKVVGKVPGAAAALKEAPAAIQEYIGETAPAKIRNALAKPNLGEFEFGANPGKGPKGVTANSLMGNRVKTAAKLSEIHGQLVEKLAPSQAPNIDMQHAIAGPVQRAMELAKADGNYALVTRLKALGEERLAQVGRRWVAAGDAQEFKQALGESIKFTEEPIEASVNQVKMDIYREVNAQISDRVPAARHLNDQQANLIGYRRALDKRLDLAAREHPIEVNPLKWAAKVGRSTAVQTRLASALERFAPKPPALPETPPTQYNTPPASPIIGQFIDDYINRQKGNQ